ncbi:MAG: phytanoyl-CoA dioxygenase family protein [Polyangiaceae bacterium]|nr:phytanoyl-CoA dioxygenase family protein [Polyangiaceae bacterium]
MAFTRAEAERRGFWEELAPGLGIDEARHAAPALVPDPDALCRVLRREGYINAPDVVPREVTEPLTLAVKALHRAGIPLPFAFVYADFWRVFQSVSRFVGAALGKNYRALPDFWVWLVEPRDAAHGWSAHRDRVQPAVDSDDSPNTLTVWLPLTDATPLNGCIYVLPLHLDPRFAERRWDGDDNHVVHRPEDVRALPATAGSLLAWNQNLLHWGSRASRMAAGPRVSAAFEFQRGERAPFNSPLLDPAVAPPFLARLGLIGKQVLQYQHMYPLDPDVAALATELRDAYLPLVSA